MGIGHFLENLRCYFCGAPVSHPSGICSDCRCLIQSESSKKGTLCPDCSQPQLSSREIPCPYCSAKPEEFQKIVSLSYFNGRMKEVLNQYKSGKQLNFRHFLAECLYEALVSNGWVNIPIVPIPPRRGKIHRTGWDQIDLLTRTLRKKYKIQLLRCLKRTDRVQQKTLHFADREKHMKNTLKLIRGRHRLNGYPQLILLDDVFTSGATLRAAADRLSAVYPGEILCIVICTVI